MRIRGRLYLLASCAPHPWGTDRAHGERRASGSCRDRRERTGTRRRWSRGGFRRWGLRRSLCARSGWPLEEDGEAPGSIAELCRGLVFGLCGSDHDAGYAGRELCSPDGVAVVVPSETEGADGRWDGFIEGCDRRCGRGRCRWGRCGWDHLVASALVCVG